MTEILETHSDPIPMPYIYILNHIVASNISVMTGEHLYCYIVHSLYNYYFYSFYINK